MSIMNDKSVNEKEKNVNDLGGFQTGYEIAEQQKKKTIAPAMNHIDGIARAYGVPDSVANLFFVEITGSLYVKAPGLLWLAGKKGDFSTEMTETYDPSKGEWTCVVKVMPRVTIPAMRELEKFTPEIQKTLLWSMTQPVVGVGRAGPTNVEHEHSRKFLREIAQTRAMNRALRIYTQYGGTSYEELPTGDIETSQ